MTPDSFRALLETAMYLGWCRPVREREPNGEQLWHQMMKKKRRISMDAFLRIVSAEKFEEDSKYTLDELCGQDHTAAPYRSVWGDKPCVFFASSGFEFIWIT
jgi:hypothetical protein